MIFRRERQAPVRVLVVDDESYICITISRWLTPEGYHCELAASAEQALEKLAAESFELMISDITMPGKSGIELLGICNERYPEMAVLMATAIDRREVAIRALEMGAYGYMIKPFDKNEFIINVANALERRRLTLLSRHYEQELRREVEERTAAIRAREEEIVLRLIGASEYRDDYTGKHIKRIGVLSAALAQEIGWPAEEVDRLRLAAPMHDVGKIGIPDAILGKPGRLTAEEFEQIKQHSLIGAGMLADSSVPLLQLAHDIALAHHEWWDGSGYPRGLKGEAIPEAARIVAIVDAYDSMVYDRVYRPALSEAKALEIITAERGTHFDPALVDIFLEKFPLFRALREPLADQE